MIFPRRSEMIQVPQSHACDVAVFRREAQFAGVVEEALEVEGDGGAGFLGYFVFDGEVEVVGTVAEAFERGSILREDRGADARDVVEINAGER